MICRTKIFFNCIKGYSAVKQFLFRIGAENESYENNAFERKRREKLSVEYEIKKVGLSPFGSPELFSPLRLISNFEKYRVFAGLEFKLAKLHQISLAYGIQHNFTNANNEYIIVFGYKYKIEFKKKLKELFINGSLKPNLCRKFLKWN